MCVRVFTKRIPKWFYPEVVSQNCHEMTLELVHGADFACVLHHFSSPTRLKGPWSQNLAQNSQKPKLKFKF